MTFEALLLFLLMNITELTTKFVAVDWNLVETWAIKNHVGG
jgi:hypothetical protein